MTSHEIIQFIHSYGDLSTNLRLRCRLNLTFEDDKTHWKNIHDYEYLSPTDTSSHQRMAHQAALKRLDDFVEEYRDRLMGFFNPIRERLIYQSKQKSIGLECLKSPGGSFAYLSYDGSSLIGEDGFYDRRHYKFCNLASLEGDLTCLQGFENKNLELFCLRHEKFSMSVHGQSLHDASRRVQFYTKHHTTFPSQWSLERMPHALQKNL